MGSNYVQEPKERLSRSMMAATASVPLVFWTMTCYVTSLSTVEAHSFAHTAQTLIWHKVVDLDA